MDFGQIQTLWTANGGDPRWAPLMAGIALAESGGNTTALDNNPATHDYSVGLWQINYFGSLLPGRTKEFGSPATLRGSPDLQAKAAISIWGNGAGKSAWKGDKTWNAWKAAGFPQYPSAATVNGWLTSTKVGLGQASASSSPATTAVTVGPPNPGPTIAPPAFGFASNIANGDIIINGTSLDVNIQNALVSAELNLSISEASTFTLTLHDPDRVLINSVIFQQKSIVSLGGLIGLQFSLVSVQKQGTVLTAIFESYVIAALRTATGAIVVAPGQMSRTEFAKMLVGQIAGATFSQAPAAYLQTIGYDINSREQLSRGVAGTPLEDSWTCLQRLASEIQWVCFESYGTVYFGPYSWLVAQSPIMQPMEFTGGIDTIDGTYDVFQPVGNVTVNAKADSWIPVPGQCVLIQNLGPFNGNWIVAEMDRPDVMEPDITVTLMQPLPGLPEPTTGGAAAAVGAGTVNPTAPQTTGGSTQAAGAVSFCVKQIGKPYGWGDAGPSAFDCSGLVYAAYLTQGKDITRTTFSQWPTAAGAGVPVGITNLKPGDLVYFGGSDGTLNSPGHVAIVTKTNTATNVVTVIDAFETGVPIRYDSFTYVTPGGRTSFAGTYFGALRPAP